MRIITATIATLLLLTAGGLAIVTTASPADAHTPDIGASCETLTVYAQGTGYEAGDTNTATVTLDGQTATDTFATNGGVSLPIPADGQPHTWTATVETSNPNPAYDAHDEGTITCGEPTPTETPTPSDTPTPTSTPTPTEPPTSTPPTETPTPPTPPTPPHHHPHPAPPAPPIEVDAGL